MKKTLFAVGPDGQVAKRKTDKSYVFVVWVRPTVETWRNYTEGLIKHDENVKAHYNELLNRGDKVLEGFTADDVRRWIATIDENNEKRRKRLDEGYSNDPSTAWKVAGWCGRADLAAKTARAFDGYDTLIVDVFDHAPTVAEIGARLEKWRLNA